ncbi:MAG TPA: GDSL-type esterase/lipase family protein [Candidatus Acidoferrum sp.]|nr:GDSL-type esterase/lipase family protein [Candidatus Acidoferrum sp.]
MKISRVLPLGLVSALLALNSCADRHNSSSALTVSPQSAVVESSTSRPARRVPAWDALFRYDGRFDFSDSNAPVIIWQASCIGLDFSGDSLALLFDDAKGQCFFNATVDGSNTVVEVREGQPVHPTSLVGLGSGRHHFELFKRSEADAGTVRFRGVELSHGGQAWTPALPAYRLRMEFFGDSITVGACNEDGPADQWETRRTHNAALSYAALTAQAFSADCRNIAVSGMGIATGWVNKKAGEVWDKIYPNPASPRAALTNWVPQVVFVNFGENDDSYPRAHGQPFPAGYTDGYVALVRAIRAAYPAAHIVLLRGGMYGGAKSEPLRTAWEAAVAQLEASDPNATHFVFTHWTGPHPRVADDRAMADELIAWLKQQPFMQAYSQLPQS